MPAFEIGDDPLDPVTDAFIILDALGAGEFRFQVGEERRGGITQAQLADAAFGHRDQQKTERARHGAVEDRHAGAKLLVRRWRHAQLFVALFIKPARRTVSGAINGISDALARANMRLKILKPQVGLVFAGRYAGRPLEDTLQMIGTDAKARAQLGQTGRLRMDLQQVLADIRHQFRLIVLRFARHSA